MSDQIDLTDASDYVRLREQARVGRGLWIGLKYHKQEVGTSHPIDNYLPDDPHITLLHLGKRVDDDMVQVAQLAVQSVTKTSMPWWPMPLEITGVGWFWRKNAPTLVALVNSAALCEVRQGLLHGVVARRKDYRQDRYGFIPHLTLDATTGAEHAAAHLARCPALRWQVSNLQIHCGEVIIDMEHHSPW